MRKLPVLLTVVLLVSACGTNHNSTRLAAALEAGRPQTLVIYGTSIESNRNGQIWTGQVAEAMNLTYEGQLTIYNAGKSGQNSRWALENIQDSVLVRNPDAVVLEFSTNDAVDRFGITVDECRRNTEQLIERILDHNPDCEIVLLTACGFPLGKGAESRKTLDSYTDVYRSIADERDLLLVDVASFLKRIGTEFGADSVRYYVRDGIHSSDRGARELFFPMLFRALSGGRPLPSAAGFRNLSTGNRLDWRSSSWVVENQSDSLGVRKIAGKLELYVPSGLTLWYDKYLSGDYRISYDICLVMAGGPYDRLSDMNCFWAASDPENPRDIYRNADLRNGYFSSYDNLNLMYVGFGGNHNTTTRFRRYYSKYYGSDDNKPVIGEYLDPSHLLIPNHWYHVSIEVIGKRTTWLLDGEALFSCDLPDGFGDGYFAFRFLRNHVMISDFKVDKL